MPAKIDLMSLERALRNTDDFPKLARQYFKEVESSPGKLSFDLVDPGLIIPPPAGTDRRETHYEFKDIPGGIAGWLIRCEVNNRLDRYDERKLTQPNAIRVVAEGDSWFQHPLIHDLIDHINNDPEFNVLSLASAGSELGQMIDPADYLKAVRKEQPKLFLLSAGGNDFLGDIRPFVRPDRAPFPDTPAGYIKQPQYRALLEKLRGWLQEVFAAVLKKGTSVERVLMHTYAHVIPVPPANPSTPVPHNDDRAGPWLGLRFDELGFRDDNTRYEVAKAMLDQYRALCAEVAAEARWGGRVEVFSFKTELSKPSQWFDEIHPKNGPAGKLAAEYLARMKAA